MQENKHLKMPIIQRLNLLLVGGLVWVIMGGLMIFLGYRKMLVANQSILLYFLIAVAVFYITFVYIFKKLAYKYSGRIIHQKDESIAVWKVFNVEGYLIMALLIVGGFYIGSLDQLNPIWWAPAYIGLGLTLVVSGVMYWVGYAKEKLRRSEK